MSDNETRPVTRRRVRVAAAANPGKRIVMICGCIGVTCSADPGDYWLKGEDEPFKECRVCGEPFELGYTRSEWVPV